MPTAQVIEDLKTRILANYSLLLLNTWEEERWESELSSMALDLRRGLVTWSVTEGFKPPLNEKLDIINEPVEVLSEVLKYPDDHVVLLFDFHPYLTDPRVVR